MLRQVLDGKKSGSPQVLTAMSYLVVQGAKENAITERREFQREGVVGQSQGPASTQSPWRAESASLCLRACKAWRGNWSPGKGEQTECGS